MNNDNDFNTSFLKYGIDLGFILSGFFGALLLSLKNKKKSVGKSISTIIAGTASANYLTPLILNFAPESIHDKGKYAVAFMMGYIGLKGLETIIDVCSEHLRSKIDSTKTEEYTKK